MTAEGAEALAVLVKVAKIKELSLYMNDMGDAGMYKVSQDQCCGWQELRICCQDA